MTDASSHGGAPPDDEPRTPAWLTALGVALFVAVAVAWVASRPKSPPAAGESAPSASAGTPSPPPGGGPHR